MFTQIKETLKLRLFTYLKIRLIYYLRPVVLRLDQDVCQIKIPLTKRSMNHLSSMYFGALATGADLAGGLMVMWGIQRTGKKISFVFKDFQAEFLKRATDDVVFTCTQGALIKSLVDRAASSYDRVEETLDVIAVVPSVSMDEPIARFKLTISLRQRKDK